MRVSKIQTYLSEKMHLRKVITKKTCNQHKILRFLIPIMTYFRQKNVRPLLQNGKIVQNQLPLLSMHGSPERRK
jgi:hypothetical protein